MVAHGAIYIINNLIMNAKSNTTHIRKNLSKNNHTRWIDREWIYPPTADNQDIEQNT